MCKQKRENLIKKFKDLGIYSSLKSLNLGILIYHLLLIWFMASLNLSNFDYSSSCDITNILIGCDTEIIYCINNENNEDN